MKAIPALLCLGALLGLGAAANAQVTPTTPTKFAKRDTGAGASSSTTISNTGSGGATTGVSQPKAEAMVRTITYVVLSRPRQWTSNDGKPLLAELIGFEDVVTVVPKGDAAAAAAKPTMPPGKPTVVRDGKVRLLVSQKPFEVSLDRLSAADQEFVNTMKRAVDAAK